MPFGQVCKRVTGWIQCGIFTDFSCAPITLYVDLAWLLANHCKVTLFFYNRQVVIKKRGCTWPNVAVHPRIYLYERSYSIVIEHRLLYDTLSHHGVGNLHEACNIGTLHVVDIAISLCAVLNTVLMDVLHNPEELSVNLFCRP